jgi:hypothetical protein
MDASAPQTDVVLDGEFDVDEVADHHNASR